MKRSIKLISIAIFITFILSGCSHNNEVKINNKQVDKTNEVKKQVKKEKEDYIKYKYKNSDENKYNEENTKVYYSTSISYPEFTCSNNKELENKINNIVKKKQKLFQIYLFLHMVERRPMYF